MRAQGWAWLFVVAVGCGSSFSAGEALQSGAGGSTSADGGGSSNAGGDASVGGANNGGANNGGSMMAGPEPLLEMPCGSQMCVVGVQVCCYEPEPSVATCTTALECKSSAFSCAGKSDCPVAGEECCVNKKADAFVSACASSCPSDHTLCTDDPLVCSAGQKCGPAEVLPPGYLVCTGTSGGTD